MIRNCQWNTLSGSNLQYFQRIGLSKDIALHVIVENIKFEVNRCGLHFSKKVFINEIISKKSDRVKGRTLLCKTE